MQTRAGLWGWSVSEPVCGFRGRRASFIAAKQMFTLFLDLLLDGKFIAFALGCSSCAGESIRREWELAGGQRRGLC